MNAQTDTIVLGHDPLPAVGPAVLTMGVFDGVHRGHQALLAATRSSADERGVASVALVFDPHPDEVLRPGTRVPRLAPLATNVERISGDLGLDRAIALRFDDELRARLAEEFLALLPPAIEPRAIVVSPESAFGRGRGGTPDRLRQIGAAQGFDVIVVDPVATEGAVISSMRLRTLLAAGDVAAVAAMGYPPTLVGVPDTAGELRCDYLPALPAAGAYDGRLHAPGTREAGARVEVVVEAGGEPYRISLRWPQGAPASPAAVPLEVRLTGRR